MVKKTVALYSISMVVGLYTTFVLMQLWNWFVVPVFHVSEISFWLMFGLHMLVGVFRGSSDLQEQTRFKTITTALDACIPPDKCDEVKEQLDELGRQVWWDAGGEVFGKVIANTFTLGVGFVIHMLA